jgi:hypothetical protein
MKKFLTVISFLFIAAFTTCSAMASSIDLSAFTADPGVSLNGGVVTFTPNDLVANYLYNDSFLFGATDTVLSFDYSLTLGQDSNDFLVFDLNFNQTVLTDVTGGGHFSIDLSSFQGTQVSIDWALIWGGNDETGTTATVSNIDLAQNDSPAPTPEPSTFLLFGGGIVGLLYIGRRKLRLTS